MSDAPPTRAPLRLDPATRDALVRALARLIFERERLDNALRAQRRLDG